MNCLEFRRRCLIDPCHLGDEAARHARHCAACAQFLREQHARERHLRAALDVAVPSGLEARVLLRQSFVHQARAWPRVAIAASIAVAVGAGVLGWQWNRAPSLEDAILAHIRAEPEHLAAAGPASGEKVTAVLAALGVHVDGELGTVRYAGLCEIARRPAGHMVLAGTRGPVTVLLVPGPATGATHAVRDTGYQGIVVPGTRGTIAIVGEPGEPLAPIAERLQLRFAG